MTPHILITYTTSRVPAPGFGATHVKSTEDLNAEVRCVTALPF